jgi:translation elongation factor EF-1beta
MSDNEYTKTIAHPMEDMLDIEAGTTNVPAVPPRESQLTVVDEYDEKDQEIEEQLQEIFDTAMDAYEQQALDIESIEPKYRARNQEVAVQYLNTALSAVKEKSNTKMAKDKMKTKEVAAGPKTLNQNVIVADRNDLLKQIFGNEETDG